MSSSIGSKEDDPWDVIVIGAGISGMTAAYRILKSDSNAKVLVLEAKDRVGGRTETVEMNAALGKDVWDVGGQWIGTTQHHIIWLMDELGITKFPQYTEGTNIMQLSDDKIRTFTGSMPKLPLMSYIDMFRFVLAVDRMAKTVPIDDPMKAKNAEKWDSITLETLIRKYIWTQTSYDFLSLVFYQEIGAKAMTISLLGFLLDMNTAGGSLMGDGINSIGFKIKGGAMQICEKLRDIVGKDNVLIGEPVTLIDQSDEDIIRVTTATGKDFKCRYVINASPLQCSVAMDYLPIQPIVRSELALHSPPGHSFKFIITYKTAFWREKGYSGQVITTGGKPVLPDTTSGPLQAIWDAGTPNGNPALVGFYANGKEWGNKTDEECKGAVLNALAVYFGDEAKEPIDFVQKDWSKEPYTGGCPGNVRAPGAITYSYDGSRQPFDRVHWGGTESATLWRSFMSGAVQSGLRAADEVLERLLPGLPKDDLLKQLDEKRNKKPSKATAKKTKKL